MSDPKLYSVEEAGKILGIEARILEYWEEIQLIPQSRRNSLGHSVYSAVDIMLIGRMRELEIIGLPEATGGVDDTSEAVEYGWSDGHTGLPGYIPYDPPPPPSSGGLLQAGLGGDVDEDDNPR